MPDSFDPDVGGLCFEQNNQKWFHGTAFTGAVHDPDFQEIAQRFLCGDITEHGTLTDTQKALIRLVALTT